MEHFHQPTEATRTRTTLSPQAQAGLFTWVSGAVTRSINLLQLAAANGQTSTPDPTVAALLTAIRASTATTGTVTTRRGFHQHAALRVSESRDQE
jgi:hypothetical protein